MLDRLGVECVSTRIYREVVEPERPAFTNNALDPQGTLLLDGFTTVIFAEQNGKTKLTLETMGIGRVSYDAQMLAEWKRMDPALDRLVALLANS